MSYAMDLVFKLSSFQQVYTCNYNILGEESSGIEQVNIQSNTCKVGQIRCVQFNYYRIVSSFMFVICIIGNKYILIASDPISSNIQQH